MKNRQTDTQLTIADAIDAFIARLDLRLNRAPRTVRTYQTALNRFADYLDQADLPVRQTPTTALKVDHALDFVAWLTGEHFGGQNVPRATLRTYLAALSRFYDYLSIEKLVDIPAEDRVRLDEEFREIRKGGRRPLPKLPPEEAVEAIVAAAESVPVDDEDPRARLIRLRDIAIVHILRSSGMRVGELAQLRREDLDPVNRAVRVLHGKGGRQRLAYLDRRAWDALQAYLAARDAGRRGKTLGHLPLIARHDKRAGDRVLPLSTNGIRDVLDRLALAAGLEETITPHQFRHRFATQVLSKTGDLAVTQDLLGHASPETTRIYAQVASQRLRDAHRRAFGE